MVKSKALTKKTWKMFSINKPYTENLPIQPSLNVPNMARKKQDQKRKKKKKIENSSTFHSEKIKTLYARSRQSLDR